MSDNTAAQSGRSLAFIVPTLNASAAQDEDIVQLLLYAASRVDRLVAGSAHNDVTATVLSLEQDTSGWNTLSTLFPAESLKHLRSEAIQEPLTPCLAIPAHKSAYDVYEFLKQHPFSEVHCLDRYGLVYYPTQAKRLGMSFLNTQFCVHVVGGTLFRRECQDLLLDDPDLLASDLLERGSLERADVLYIHDGKAWRWYEHKVVTSPETKIYDMAGLEPPRSTPITSETEPASSIPAVIYCGPLGADGGLPAFCDVVDCLVSENMRPAEVILVGATQAIGGIDAVTYIRLRSAVWRVPITIRRDLSIADEVAFVAARHGVVVCNSVRRDHLRSRLLPGLHLRTLHIGHAPLLQHTQGGEAGCPTPKELADALRHLVELPEPPLAGHPSLVELWRASSNVPIDEPITSRCLPLDMPGEQQPRVSVCVTHFSRPHRLRTALESLKHQTYKNFEVIVVDDGSPSSEVQRELALIREDIEPLGWRVLFQDNRYLGAARNFAARHATSEYLIFMDDDNVAKPHEISMFVAVAQRTGADIVTTFCDVFSDEATLEHGPPPLRFTPYGSDPALGVFTNCFGDANALYSRRAFDKLGGFTEDYGITHEDWELFCRASLEGFTIQCIPEPLFWYRMDQNAMFRGQRTQLHKSANLRRHIRPYLEKLPPYQANLVQLLQGLTTTLPLTTVGPSSRAVAPLVLRQPDTPLPYGRVGIIMRTKDRPLLLRRAIRSVLSQTFKDWVLVIVNDGGSPELLERVLDELSDELGDRLLTVHHPIPLGMQSASNSGMTHCDSDFIIIHDDDDSWDPSFLARTVSHLDGCSWNARLGGVITWSWVIVEELSDDGAINIHNRFVFNDKLHNIALIDLAIENRFPPISFLFKRAVLDSIGPFKAQYGPLGDWEFHLRLLQHFDIDVIPDPLANYHHRTNTTTGVYGNSVHAQKDQHQSSRIDLMNHAIRDELGSGRGLSLAQLLTLGELQYSSRAEQTKEFQRLHDYMWNMDQRIQHIATQVQRSSKSGLRGRRRNLTSNGDFRQWPGLGEIHAGTGEAYYFRDICPGFILCYDGRQASYRIEQRKWTTDGQQLPFGKSFLHIENDGYTKGSSWFVVECTISSALLLAGQSIAISGTSRLNSIDSWLTIGGRYNLGDGRLLSWPETRIAVSSDFSRWSCSLVCPAIQDTEVRPGHHSRILLKLPHNQPFDFDLTDFQVELGTHPSDFEYSSGLSLRHTFGMVWQRVKRKLRTLKRTLH